MQTLQRLCEAQVLQVPWVKHVEVQLLMGLQLLTERQVSLLPPKPPQGTRKSGDKKGKSKGLADVKHIIAVASCKVQAALGAFLTVLLRGASASQPQRSISQPPSPS